MSTDRKMAALRALAERPGTEAEGRVAREMLAKLEARGNPEKVAGNALEDYLRSHNLDAFLNRLKREYPIPTTWPCACGKVNPIGSRCTNRLLHLQIQKEISLKFKRGDRVFYNRWAYPSNCPCTVSGHVRMDHRENGDYPWGWIRVKFDHLKSIRAVPIYSELGWHLTKEPLEREAAERLGKR